MVAARLDDVPVGMWHVLTGVGALDLASAPGLRRTLLEVIGAGAPAVSVDLTGVDLLDCACIASLVEGARRVATQGTRMHVVGASGRVRRALEITGAAVELG